MGYDQKEPSPARQTLRVFEATCGHRWIGSLEGVYDCPVCGLYDGDHHIVGAEELPVQLHSCGIWEALAEEERW